MPDCHSGIRAKFVGVFREYGHETSQKSSLICPTERSTP